MKRDLRQQLIATYTERARGHEKAAQAASDRISTHRRVADRQKTGQAMLAHYVRADLYRELIKELTV